MFPPLKKKLEITKQIVYLFMWGILSRELYIQYVQLYLNFFGGEIVNFAKKMREEDQQIC
jgi:hypothetical protein